MIKIHPCIFIMESALHFRYCHPGNQVWYKIMLFNDLCYEWLEWKKPFVKSKTYETYYGTFVNQIEPFFKKVRCSAVNEDFLDKYSVAVQTSTLNRFNHRPSKNVASKAFQVI